MPAFIVVALAAAGTAWGAELNGKVMDRLDQAIPGVRVCLPWSASSCVHSDAGGAFLLSVPAGVRPEGFGVLKALPRGSDGPAFDALGRRNFQGTSPAPTFFRSLATAWIRPATKRSDSLSDALYDLDLSKPGYRTAREGAFPWPSVNHFTLAKSGDSGYFRTMRFSTEIVSIDRTTHRVTTKARWIECEGSERVVDTGSWEGIIGVVGGSLYAGVGYDTCVTSRFTGGGPDVLGTWTLVERRVEWPAALRPEGCRAPILYPDPLPPGFSLRYTIQEKSIASEIRMEYCPGDEIIYDIRDYLETDLDTRMVEATCRHTVWRNSAGIDARVDYAPKGGQDSITVTFKSGGKTCSYVEPGYVPEGPPTCPDPSDADQDAFASCVEASGFSPAAPALFKSGGLPAKLRRPISRSRATGLTALDARRR